MGVVGRDSDCGDSGTRKRVGGGTGEDSFVERIDRHSVDEGVVMTEKINSGGEADVPISNVVSNMSISVFDKIPSTLSSIREGVGKPFCRPDFVYFRSLQVSSRTRTID